MIIITTRIKKCSLANVDELWASTETNKELSGLGTQNFYFQDRKNLKFQDIFQDMRVTKTRFLSFRAHITSERLELRLKLLYDDMK